MISKATERELEALIARLEKSTNPDDEIVLAVLCATLAAVYGEQLRALLAVVGDFSRESIRQLDSPHN